jgi:Cys-rich protein (TIGR01571 family)
VHFLTILQSYLKMQTPVRHQLHEEPLFDCFKDTDICLLGYFCPCVIVARNANFVRNNGVVFGACCLFLPIFAPCIGAVIRQRLAIYIGDIPPNFLFAYVANSSKLAPLHVPLPCLSIGVCGFRCIWNHTCCFPCSICQEARIARGARTMSPSHDMHR